MGNAATIQGRLLLKMHPLDVRLQFKGGYYLRAATNSDFTVAHLKGENGHPARFSSAFPSIVSK